MRDYEREKVNGRPPFVLVSRKTKWDMYTGVFRWGMFSRFLSVSRRDECVRVREWRNEIVQKLEGVSEEGRIGPPFTGLEGDDIEEDHGDIRGIVVDDVVSRLSDCVVSLNF